MSVVDFNLATLSDVAVDLITTACGSGWLFEQLSAERARRSTADAGPPDYMVLPNLDLTTMCIEYREARRSLMAVENRQIALAELDPMAAQDLEAVATLFYEILQALRRAAAGPSAAN